MFPQKSGFLRVVSSFHRIIDFDKTFIELAIGNVTVFSYDIAIVSFAICKHRIYLAKSYISLGNRKNNNLAN